MKEMMSCEACGASVEVDLALGVEYLVEPPTSLAAGRGSIIEGAIIVHQCAAGTY